MRNLPGDRCGTGVPLKAPRLPKTHYAAEETNQTPVDTDSHPDPGQDLTYSLAVRVHQFHESNPSTTSMLGIAKISISNEAAYSPRQ